MDKSSETLIVWIISLAAGIMITYWLIRSANSIKRRDTTSMRTLKVLALLAEKMGVNTDDIKKSLDSEL